MKLLGALAAMVLILTALIVATLVQLAITLAPFLVAALVVVLILRARPRTRPLPPGIGWPRTGPPVDSAQQYRVGAPAAARGGWLMVPVWVAPAPGPPIIDAEVLGERD